MYICVCNQITDQDLKNNPELIDACGTDCGTCIEFLMKETESRADAGSIPAASTIRVPQYPYDGGELDSTDD